MARFTLNTQILFGSGMEEELFSRFSRVLIVTDRTMTESGKTAYITDCLDRHGSVYRCFDAITPDPDLDLITEGVNVLMDFKPEAVAALGGGSAIDAAKAILLFARKADARADVPLIAIPTTSGTGSEVSRFAVVTDRVRQVKLPLTDDNLLPDYAVLDAGLTASMPPRITADTGMDVLTHALEAFASTEASDFSDAAAEKSLELIHEHLLEAHARPDNERARQGMHNASCLAGIAFSNAGLGLTHSMAHALGARFNIPHGRANAILLPYVMSFNAGCVDALTPTAKRYASLARVIALETASVRQSALNLIHLVRQLQRRMGMPTTIAAAGVSAADFEAAIEPLADAALADRCTLTNPRACSRAELIRLFRHAYTGKPT